MQAPKEKLYARDGSGVQPFNRPLRPTLSPRERARKDDALVSLLPPGEGLELRGLRSFFKLVCTKISIQKVHSYWRDWR